MAVKNWAANRLAAQRQSKDDLLRNLADWDVKAENDSINPLDIEKREEWLMDLSQLEQIHRDDHKQKCRLKWAVEGDENTRFFHSLLKNKFANSMIKGIYLDGVWCEAPDQTKKAAFDHLSSRFKECDLNRPCFNSPLFRKLSSSDACILESNIFIDEIKGAVWDCDGSKAPGPDGFNFKGVSLAEEGTNVSLLKYADDTLFFGEWSRLNARNLILILKCFEKASSLKIIVSKSRIFGIGIPDAEVEEIASSLGCLHDVIPFMYLGLPIEKKMRFCDGWNEGFKDEQLGIFSVKWKCILLSFDMGGLDFYGGDGGFGSPSDSFCRMGTWCDILKGVEYTEKIVPVFKQSFVQKVTSGSNVLFWKDSWCGNGLRLMDLFPRLYALQTAKDCKVRDRWRFSNGVWGGNWEWRLPPRGRSIDDVAALIFVISNLSFSYDDTDIDS
ncbi:hypothetical protein Tco_0412171 [Tanacetum coccineum]